MHCGHICVLVVQATLGLLPCQIWYTQEDQNYSVLEGRTSEKASTLEELD